LEGEEDCISFRKNEIIVFSIYLWEIKQTINIHEDEILNIAKITFNRIISSSKDGKVKIVKMHENNTKSEVIYDIDLKKKYAPQILFLNNEDILLVNDENNVLFYSLRENIYIFDKSFIEDSQILKIKELTNDKIIYISENKIGNKFLNFINLNNKIKEENAINIEEDKRHNLKIIDLLDFFDYILICYNYRIDIINYKDKFSKVKSLKYFKFELINII